MKNKHLFWGFLFLTIGTLILINNFASVDFEINLWKIWPLFLILLGIGLLIKNEIIRGIVFSLTAIVLGAALFSTFNTGWHHFKNETHININDSDEDNETKVFEEEFNNEIKFASLNLVANAGLFKIGDTTNILFKAITSGYHTNYSISRLEDNGKVKINFKNKEDGFSIFKGKKKNRVNINLNPNPVWDLNFDVGAASTEFDLREYKVSNLDIDIGAAALKLYVGDKQDTCKINIDAGASSIEVYVPESVGCEINSDIFLSSRKLDGFIKTGDDYYRSENFNSTSKRIFMNVDSGVSSFKVKRYNSEDW